jgi:NADH-quinone oxidoreductase subunit E
MVQVNKDYYEDLTPENFEALLDAFKRGRNPKPGPQNGRQCSAPASGPKTLTDPSIYKSKSGGNAGGEA